MGRLVERRRSPGRRDHDHRRARDRAGAVMDFPAVARSSKVERGAAAARPAIEAMGGERAAERRRTDPPCAREEQAAGRHRDPGAGGRLRPVEPGKEARGPALGGEPRLAQALGLVVLELHHAARIEIHAALEAEHRQAPGGVLEPGGGELAERGGVRREARVERTLRIPGGLGCKAVVTVEQGDAPAAGGEACRG